MKTKTISIRAQSHAYPVYVGYQDPLKNLSSKLNALTKQKKLIIITSPKISSLYKSTIKKHFDSSWTLSWVLISDFEKDKNLSEVQKIISSLIKLNADRHTMLCALGGGVIGDMTAFVASIYMRGLPYINIPTTLLAQVDSSIGGKCGVNLPQGKNLIGSFYHPKAVFSDIQFLKSLSDRDFKSGLGEVIKYSILDKNSLYKDLLHYKKEILDRNPKILEKIITLCVKIKKKFIEADEKDFGKRHFLNLGHTLGHALETNSKYKTLTHGEAVAQGIYFASHLSLKKKLCSTVTDQKVKTLLQAYGFKTQKISSRVFTHIAQDKKRSGNSIPWVLIQDIGKVCQYKMSLT